MFIYRYYKNYKADLILVGNIARPVNKQFFKVELKKNLFFTLVEDPFWIKG